MRDGRRVAWILLSLCLLLLVALPAAAQYRSVTVESLRVTVDSDWGGQGAPGYIPARFDIENLGEARTIEIVGRGSRYGNINAGSVAVRQTIRLRPGDHVHWTAPIPVGPYFTTIQFALNEGPTTLETFNFTAYRGEVGIDQTPVLIVSDRGTPLETAARSWLRSAPMPAYGRGGSVGRVGATPNFDFILPPARLPENWLPYSTLRAVFIGPTEWSRLTETQKNALTAWVAAGGDLIILDGDAPALIPALRSAEIDSSKPGRPWRYLLGHVFAAQSTSVTSSGIDGILSSTNGPIEESNLVLPVTRGSSWAQVSERGFRLPIDGVNGVPARAYLWILVAFSVLIGPANYIFLWRKRQQPLIVLTVPLISAAFVVLLAGYAIAGEGFGVRGRAATFTILDQAGRQAATRAAVSLYAAGMTPGGGMNFPRDYAVVSLGVDGRGNREETLDLTESQRFASGTIRARMPANFEQVGFRAARERLTFDTTADAVSVVNGLGVAVEQLYYLHGGRMYALTEPLQPGARQALRAVPREEAAAKIREAVRTSGPSPERFLYAFDHLRDESYAAVLRQSPFWEAGVATVEERGSFHFLVGLLERGS